MPVIPPVASPLPIPNRWARSLAPADPLKWLAQGWRDLMTHPAMSLVYGLLIFLISVGFIGGLVVLGRDYILFPAFAGFMVVGPILAVGLYEKSRLIEGGIAVRWRNLFFVKPRSGGQVLFTGVLLCLLVMVWMRAAVIIYALFFGVVAFPELNRIASMLFTTRTGWAMLAVGTAVGGLFVCNQRLFHTHAARPERRCPHGDGQQHGAGLEQSASPVDLGRNRAGAF